MENFGSQVADFKSKIDISEIISNYIQLTDGKYGCCPFHEDHHPSLFVNSDKQYFHCFACGAGGDVISFVQKKDGISFAAAIKKLSEITGKDPGFVLSPQSNSESEDLNIISNIRWDTISYYHSQLEETSIKYLNERGTNEESNTEFLIGYANGRLREYLISKNYPVELCIKAGVLKRNKDGEIRDVFFNRIIIPNIVNGSVAFISSRSLDNSTPKYLNQSGQLSKLFNEDKLKNKKVLLTEGILDAIIANQFGFEAVSLYGVNSFTPGQLKNKFSNQDMVNICFDTDEAGKEATIKIAQELGEKARIINLPDAKDLNDYLLKHSKEEFQTLISNSVDLFSFLINQIPSDILRDHLYEALRPSLMLLATMEAPKVQSNLQKIKIRFNLSLKELDSYEKFVKKIGKRINNEKKAFRSNNKKRIKKAIFPGLIDIVDDNGQIKFLILKANELIVVDEYQYENETYIPPEGKQIPWMLSRAQEVKKHYAQYLKDSPEDINNRLFEDLITYFKSISDLPNEYLYRFFPVWVVHTYFQEKIQFTPYLVFQGLAEKGKSRTAKALTYTSYRGTNIPTIREPNIFRLAQNFSATLFLDLKNFWKSVINGNCQDIFLTRFEKGAKVARVLYPEKGAFDDTEFYFIFGPTVIATNVPTDDIFETRCITIIMVESKKQFTSDVKEENSLELRERLLAMRAYYYNSELPGVEKPANGRLGDILKCIRQVIVKFWPEEEEDFMKFVQILIKERKESKSETVYARLLAVIVSLELLVSNGKLSIKDITESYNEGKNARFHTTNGSVGRKLRHLGFQKTTLNDGTKAIIYDKVLINKLCEDNGIIIKKSDGTSEENPSGD